MTMDRRPIGVFDSGLGGLCAVSELTKILPGEDIIYFGDTGRVPYGSRSIQTLRKYAAEDVAFLLSHDVKMILAACGTVSSSVLEDLTGECPVPLLGVVDGAVKKAVSLCQSGKIGIIGTETTVNSGIFERKIHEIMPDAELKSIACPLFVPLVENGFISRDCEITRLMCRHYLAEMKAFSPDVLILGCTHFPIISGIIADFMPDVALVDPAKEAAHELLRALNDAGIASDRTHGEVKYFVSDAPERFSANAWIFLGGENEIKANKVEL